MIITNNIIICVFLARETDASKVNFSNGWFGVSVLSAGHNDAVWVCYFLESMNYCLQVMLKKGHFIYYLFFELLLWSRGLGIANTLPIKPWLHRLFLSSPFFFKQIVEIIL